jgi:hypothetical protein
MNYQRVHTIVGYKKVVKLRSVRKGTTNKIKTELEVYSYHTAVYGWKIVKLERPREWWVFVDEGTEVVWWYDKDIGVEHILRKQS